MRPGGHRAALGTTSLMLVLITVISRYMLRDLAWVPASQTSKSQSSHGTALSAVGTIEKQVDTPSADTDNRVSSTFTSREVGSAEQLMLMRRDDGKMVSTHCFTAIVSGHINVDLLKGALRWAVLRHPMLRATAHEIKEGGNSNPFLRSGKDGRWMWHPSNLTAEELVGRALEVVDADGDFEGTWRSKLEDMLDSSSFDFESGPMWKLTLLRGEGSINAMQFAFVHSLDDQSSGNDLVHQILSYMEAAESGQQWDDPDSMAVPASIEEALLQGEIDLARFAKYALSQAEASGFPSIKLPSSMRSSERSARKNWGLQPSQPNTYQRRGEVPSAPASGDQKLLLEKIVDPESEFSSQRRHNLISTCTLPAEVVEQLRQKCRMNNVTVSMAISAAALMAISDVSPDEHDIGYDYYRLLLGIDLRRMAEGGDWTQGTTAYASGALDFVLQLLPKSGERFAAEAEDPERSSAIGGVPFWDMTRTAALNTRSWIEKGHAAESTRLFDAGMKFLRMEKIITATANDPATLGRGYSVSVSNVGLYKHGPPNAKYGVRSLKGIYFAISTAGSGSMLSVSCATVSGELQLTAAGPSPIVSRLQLDRFTDSMKKTLTMAAMSPAKQIGYGKPREDYQASIRGGLPWFYPLETPKGGLKCPQYEDVKSSSMPPFQVDKYTGIWYELAFHDITQANVCGCTQLNMTRYGTVIEDMFTVSCPWPWKEGVDGPWLPGVSTVSGQRRFNQYTCNMTMYVRPERPGVMRETGFGQEFDNMIIEVWRDPEITAETGFEYTRAIQFQCVEPQKEGKVTFTGINFLSRTPHVSPAMMQEMFARAQSLGLEPYGSNDMHIVDHEGCRYPISTDVSWMGDRPEWPCPILLGDLGAEI